MASCDRFKYHCYCKLSLKKPTTLASLVKGRWIDGKAQALILLLSACDMPTIFMLQIFCRQDGGIASPPPFAPHQPFQNRTITLAFRSVSVYVCLYGFTFALSPSLFVGEWACPSRCTKPLHPHNHLKPPSTLIRTHPHSPFSPRVSPQLLLRFPHRQPRRRPTHNRICSSARRFAPLCLASPAFQPF